MSGAHHYHFDVVMSCGGCSGAIERNLKKAQEAGLVTSYTVTLNPEGEKIGDVEVHTPAGTRYKDVLDPIVRTRKSVRGAAEVVDGKRVPFESWAEDVKEVEAKMKAEKEAKKAGAA